MLTRLKNGSTTKTFRCVTAAVSRTGNGAFQLYSDAYGSYRVSDKVLRITPATDLVVPTTVTLFFTEAQLAGLEQSTGVARQNFQVFQVNNSLYTAATSTNTRKYSAQYSPIPGVGGTYTVTFTYYLNGYYTIGAKAAPLTQKASATATEAAGYTFTPVYPNPGRGAAYLGVTAPESGKLFIEVRNDVGQVLSTQQASAGKGSNTVALKVDALASGNYRIQVRNEKGMLLYSQNYFRN
ncbi:MAG: T9SS type A sorting domain-containing protein [Sphingobacteriales bacterium]|nr:MAG: T9SS type A sorting domain-containing protein [Sphingobacteriales bacterium]